MSAMLTRNVKCNECGFEGKMEAHDTLCIYPDEIIFKVLGKDQEGYIYLNCPKCKFDLQVEPFKSILRSIFGSKIIGVARKKTASLEKKIELEGSSEETLSIDTPKFKELEEEIQYLLLVDVNKVISKLKKVIKIYPEHPLAYYRLGEAYKQKDKDSLSADYFYKAGLLYLKQGDRLGAIKAYEKIKRTKFKDLEQVLYEKMHPKT